MGFLESLIKSFVQFAAVEASKDAKGKPDPYKAAGIFTGLNGDMSLEDLTSMGSLLGAQGAFDPDESTTTTSNVTESSDIHVYLNRVKVLKTGIVGEYLSCDTFYHPGDRVLVFEEMPKTIVGVVISSKELSDKEIIAPGIRQLPMIVDRA